MNTQNSNDRSMTGQQIVNAFSQAIRYSDKQDAQSGLEGSERRWDRLNCFVSALASEFSQVAPDLYLQLTGFQMRVIDEENSLRTARDIAEGNSK
jgi:hypothetical protein